MNKFELCSRNSRKIFYANRVEDFKYLCFYIRVYNKLRKDQKYFDRYYFWEKADFTRLKSLFQKEDGRQLK